MFGLFSRNLPRLKRGKPIPAAVTNTWPDAAERGRVVVGRGGGIEATQLPQGTALKAGRLPNHYIAVLSGTLAAATPPAYTTQTATILADTGTSPLVPTGITITVKNDHNRSFASGAQVKVAFISGGWWVYDVARCADLGASP